MKGKDPSTGKSSWRPAARTAAVLAILLGVGLLSTAYGQAPRRVMVAEVKVAGNHRVKTQRILNTINTRPGKAYVQAVVEEDIRKLYKLGAFRNIQVDTSPAPDAGQDGNTWIVVHFIVSEHPNLVTHVEVKNARHLSLDKLDLLKQIRKGTPLNPTLNQRAALEIRDYYKSKGYYFAGVNLEEGDKATDSRVIFNIAEGPLVRVRSVRFTGNDTLASSARLKTQIATKQSILRLGGVFTPGMLSYDLQKLEEYYRSNGYLTVKVGREVIPSDDFSSVDVIFHIDEGPRYQVNEVSVEGLKNISQSFAESILKTEKGQFYNGATTATDERNLIDGAGWRGYKINVVEELYYPSPGLVNVRYQVLDDVRPPARVGEVRIYGNQVTKDRVIRRLLGIYPGQILRYPELRLAEQTLARSNLFEMNPAMGIRPTVTVVENSYDPNSEYKDIHVQVQETHTGSFMLGLGVNSDAGLVGQIVLNERNFDLFRPPLSLADVFEGRAFRGAGQEFRLEAVPGTELQRYSATFREPFLFDLPYSLTVAGYYYDRIFREYTERRVGGRISVGHQLNRFWNVAGGVRIEGVRVTDVPFFAPDDYTDVVGSHFLVAPRVSVVRDSRDSYLRATEGSRIEASYEHVFGDFEFPVFNLEGSKYFTTFKRRDGSGKHVVAARAQFSWAGDDAPVFERFFAGGFRSLRGFEFRGVGPFEGGFNVGGQFMMLASLEYQLPVLANDNLYLVAFLDSGTVESDLNINNYRVTAGVGARVVVPMMGPVPIALDFGFPIVEGPFDRDQIFSFYVGITR